MFVDVKGYEGFYKVNEFGDVFSIRSNRIIKGGLFSNGYRFVILAINNIHKNALVHRLVAQAFIPQTPGKNYVNHIDGNKTNNHVSNLEWVTFSENLKHAADTGLMYSQCKIIRQTIVSKDDSVITFKSMADCSKWFGHTESWLHTFLRNHGNPVMYRGYKIEAMERRCYGSHENIHL